MNEDSSRLDTTHQVDDKQEFLNEDQKQSHIAPLEEQKEVFKGELPKVEPPKEQSAPKQQQAQSQQQQPVNNQNKSQIINELSLQRKKDGFQQLKVLEQTMLSNATNHFSVCTNIFNHLNRRATLSEQSMNTMILFFREKIQQEQNNIKALTVKNPAYLGVFKDPEPKQSKILYPNFTKVLEGYNGLTQKQAQKVQQLMQNIEKLIKDKLEYNQTQYSKLMKDFRTTQQKFISKVHDSQSNTKKYSDKLTRLFNEMMILNGQHKRRNKDLLHVEKKFNAALNDQILTQSQYGQMVLSLWNELLKQDAMRMEIILQGLQQYIENHQEAYNGTKGGAQTQLLIKQFQDFKPVQECESSLTVAEIVPAISLGYITGALQMPPGQQATAQDVQKYLTQYPLTIQRQTTIQNHPLVLKVFNKTFRDNGTLMSSWKRIVIIVSLDKNILIFDSDDGQVPHAKALYKFCIDQCELTMTKKQPLVTELKHTKPGVIFDSTEKLSIKFESSDEYEELEFYLAQNKKH